MYACRACRVPLSAASGCAVCDPIRKHLVALDENEDEAPALSTVGAEAVRALRTTLKKATAVMADKTATVAENQAATNVMFRATNALAKILEAARKLQSDGLAAVQAMSFMERAKLFIGWYAALPPPHREQVQKAMAKWEGSQAEPRELPEHAG